MIVRTSHGRKLLFAFLLFAVLAGTFHSAEADTFSVTYSATQVSGNTWQYDYLLTGSFVAGDDLAIYFPLASSSNLADMSTGGSDWGTFAFQPDPGLPADGEFDAVANVDDPSLLTVLSVQFLYSGTGSPGSQSFTLYDPNFNVITNGTTQLEQSGGVPPSPTPEPASLLLLGSALTAMAQLKRLRV
jgi:hypothetical protein